jgi:hypothetical protein
MPVVTPTTVSTASRPRWPIEIPRALMAMTAANTGWLVGSSACAICHAIAAARATCSTGQAYDLVRASLARQRPRA